MLNPGFLYLPFKPEGPVRRCYERGPLPPETCASNGGVPDRAPGRSVLYRIELPVARDAFEFVLALFVELNPRACDEQWYGS